MDYLKSIQDNDPKRRVLRVWRTANDPLVAQLAEALKMNTMLQELSLHNNHQLTMNAARAISDMLKMNTTLKRLELSKSPIGDDGARALADALHWRMWHHCGWGSGAG